MNASPDFACRLLEWFNFPAPTNTSLVLKLILDSIHICGETFVGLGGVDFFNALRQDLEVDEQRSVDVILAELKKYNLTPEGSCVSNCSFTQNLKNVESITDHLGSRHEEIRSAYFLGENRPKDVKKYPEWFRLTILPWQSLTLNDRQVLQQTNSSLCSRNISVVSDYCLFLAEIIFQDFPAEVFIQRPRIIQSFIGFISTCNDSLYLLNALRSLDIFTDKLADRLKVQEIRDLKNTESPGYPLGYEPNGPDCWEHEPVELLRQNETAMPIIIIEIAETITSLLKVVDLEVAASISQVLEKLCSIFHDSVDFDKLVNPTDQKNPSHDEVTKYILTKIRSIIEWISTSLLEYGKRTLKRGSEDSDFKFYGLLSSVIEKVLPKIAPVEVIKLVAPISLERALQYLVFESHLPNTKFYNDNAIKTRYLTVLDSHAAAAFALLRTITESLRDTNRLKTSIIESRQGLGKSDLERLISSSLKSISYHRSNTLIDAIINYSSQYHQHEHLIDCMTHKLQTVREQTFIYVKQFMDDTITTISNTGDSDYSDRIHFLTLRKRYTVVRTNMNYNKFIIQHGNLCTDRCWNKLSNIAFMIAQALYRQMQGK